MYLKRSTARCSMSEPTRSFLRNASVLVWWMRCVVGVRSIGHFQNCPIPKSLAPSSSMVFCMFPVRDEQLVPERACPCHLVPRVCIRYYKVKSGIANKKRFCLVFFKLMAAIGDGLSLASFVPRGDDKKQSTGAGTGDC